MTNPVQGDQIISSNVFVSDPISASRSISAFPVDVLTMAQSSPNRSSLSSFWNAIVNFCKSLLCCCSKDPIAQLADDVHQLKNRAGILRLAARDHFIWFYKKEENQLTAFLGNFHPCPVTLWGIQFQCAEAAFQAAKFAPNADLMRRFQNLDGEAAFNLGRELSRTWSAEEITQWLSRNLQVMHEVVAAKFNQNPDLKQLLLATRGSYLVEHVPVRSRDGFWGDNFDGTGQNRLGRIVMEVRGQLDGTGIVARNQQYDSFLRGQ
jgi:ribA/ribD-fused uncharacterized protein